MATYKKTITPRSTTTTRGGSAGTVSGSTYKQKKTATPRSTAAGAIKAATAAGRKEAASTIYKKVATPMTQKKTATPRTTVAKVAKRAVTEPMNGPVTDMAKRAVRKTKRK